MERPVRVLVVDDSALMRRMISRILTDAGFEVVGTAHDGVEGLEACAKLRPDVVTLDVQMPRMDGLTMLRRLMKENPTPVVMLSSLTRAQAPATVEALALGAVDVVAKPGGAISLNIGEVADELVRKVRVAATARVRRFSKVGGGTLRESGARRPTDAAAAPGRERLIVVVGASTGGPSALSELFSRLSGDFPAPIVVVQHMPAGFTASLAARLDSLSALAVEEARDGVLPVKGSAWVAPGGYHLVFDADGRIRLSSDPPHLGVRPAVDLTMESAAEVWGSGVIGLVLTGMGMDGARGARRIKQRGGVVLAQDEESSVVYGMPRAVVEMGFADEVASIQEMACRLEAWARKQLGQDAAAEREERGRG